MSRVCDGCGVSVDQPVTLGRVVQRDYCAECATKAKLFVDGEDALRKSMHEKFIDDRALMIANLGAENFKLPDVPDGDTRT